MNKSGFILIELSIAIVIIGLLVGGVLVGKELIKTAEIRSQISQVEEYKLAVGTFLTKYNCIPGDCNNATQFGFAPSGTAYDNGNGDGRLTNAWNYYLNAEQFNFWHQLGKSGLIPNQYQGWTPDLNTALQPTVPADAFFPKLKAGRGFVEVAGSFGYMGNSFVLANWYTDGSTNYYGRALSVPQSFLIDSKIDDGKAYSGKVVIGFPAHYADIPTATPSHDLGCTMGTDYDHVGIYAPGYVAESPYVPDRPQECILIIGGGF